MKPPNHSVVKIWSNPNLVSATCQIQGLTNSSSVSCQSEKPRKVAVSNTLHQALGWQFHLLLDDGSKHLLKNMLAKARMAFSRSLTITCARDNWTESENWAGWAGHMGQELVEGKSWVLLEPWPPGPDLSLCQPHTPTAWSWTRAWNAKFSTLGPTTITFGWDHLEPRPVLKNLPGFLFVLEIKEALVGCVLSWAPNQMGVRGSL